MFKKKLRIPFSIALVIILASILALSLSACSKKVVNVTGVAFAGGVTSKTLMVGDTFQLNATVAPDDADNKNVSWKSSAEDIAEVSASGKVTAKAVGIAVITVTTEDGNFTKNCSVYVEPAVLTSMSVSTNPTKTTYIVGQKFNPAGAVIMGVYSDGSQIEITDNCTFSPSGALTLADTEITFNCILGDTPLSQKISITVTEGNTQKVTTKEAFATALANSAYDRILYESVDADDYLTVDPFTVARNVIISGNFQTTSVTVNSGCQLTVGGMLKGNDNIAIAGDGVLEINGNLYGTDITIGKINLLLTSVVDQAEIDRLNEAEAPKGSVYDLDAVYLTSSLYATGNILINDGAVVTMYNNIYSEGTLTINGGAAVTIYGYAKNSAQMWDRYGTGINSAGDLTFEGLTTVVKLYYTESATTGKAAIQSMAGNINILGATVLVDKAPTTNAAYDYAIYLKQNTKVCTISNGAQVTLKVAGDVLGAAVTNRFVINAGTSGGESGVPATMVTMFGAKKETRGNAGIDNNSINFTLVE